MENARLFREQQEALEREAAVSDVLRVVAGSPTDLQPVVRAMLDRGLHLLRAEHGFVHLIEGDEVLLSFVNTAGFAPARTPVSEMAGNLEGEVMKSGRTEQFSGTIDAMEQAYPPAAAFHRSRGRTELASLSVPFKREGKVVGIIGFVRDEARAFTSREVEMIETFADQAVIAIENARLFREQQEALERQTAMADVLGIIAASPTTAEPVLDAIVRAAASLLVADDAFAWVLTGETESRLDAAFNSPDARLGAIRRLDDAAAGPVSIRREEDGPDPGRRRNA